MGFIFGLMVGVMATSGGSTPQILGTIPFRCLAAFEISEAEYRQCRTVSLRMELYTNTSCGNREMSDPANPCSFDKAITWEIAGLRELKKAIEQKQAAAR